MNTNFQLILIKSLFILLYLHEFYGTSSKIRVCVIGAGPSGIASTKIFGNRCAYTILNYKDSPIGAFLFFRTNGAKEIMNYPDWPKYKGVNTSSVSHYIVLEYLKNYTDHFSLRPFIKFNTIVLGVKLLKENNVDKWKVMVKNLVSSKTSELVFDSVIVCNGHFSSPYIPHVPGLKNFKGKDDFLNKSVILLGASKSGPDIGLELANAASSVYLSHNHQRLSVNLTQIKGIDRFDDGKFILKDDSTIIADALMFCTGYNYSFPFLDKSSEITVDDNYIAPLYKHMINVLHPSMIFIGVPHNTTGFLISHSQAQYAVSHLTNCTQLPTRKVMLEDSKLKTAKKKHAHQLKNYSDFIDELARLGRFPPTPKYYRIGDTVWRNFRSNHLSDFKNYNLVIEIDKMSAKVFKMS